MKFLYSHKNTIFGIFLSLCLVIIIPLLQLRYDDIVRPELYGYNIKITKHVMPENVVRNLSFGFRNILADMYWISAIQDLSGWDRTTDFYIQEYKNIATLDPYFEYPYIFGILVVSNKASPESVDQIEPVAKMGIASLPYNWEIPFYLGTQYHLVKKYPKAFHYIQVAASRPIIPALVQRLYSTYGTRNLSKEEATRALLGTMYQTTTSTTTKKVIETSLMIQGTTQELQKMVTSFKNRTGKYPTSLDDLVESNLLVSNHGLTEKFTITINQKTGEVVVTGK